MKDVTRVEVAVVGGGMVGAALAALLGDQGVRVAVLEAQPPQPFDPAQPLDLRVSAINAHSEAVYRAAGAWEGMLARRGCPYDEVRVWDQGSTAVTHFHARDVGAQQLGWFLENRIMQLALLDRLQALPSVEWLCPARPVALEPEPDALGLRLEDGRLIRADLVVGADGARSAVRAMAGIDVQVHDYGQHALLINVRTMLPHQSVTWQRFTPAGPQAFLPLPGPHACLVWYDDPQATGIRLGLDDETLRGELEAEFPEELGSLEAVLARGAFPLRRTHAQSYRAHRIALVGDAAHTIHPLAGQGVNLGLQDAEALAGLLLEAHAAGRPLHGAGLLARYEARRRPANLMMMHGMDLFKEVFCNENELLRRLRRAGLWLADHAGPAKAVVARYAEGGRPPR
ncbi:UbiH/UbiF/VisC/COQ6 family ubiquinone biosynthesis hydroxylase [Alkalilimnicola ehrlichii MLHE-1]|uniref:Ubiquinone biosynthesis hydroxylase, UbiH/UbiF/VisC/COQ6 family n=1 Tax=Alkalilimnicola ehrlichii (strain ATCC BAA-1101 / DSM 17681 / MLHE-1) TaxID=187272 RepID=Q0AC50_ALKEH|nr:UbiH/UbiF/VisC/COQ6 family ubiquinone biosynthesis hydroxylase [Alkalilimnicola ehrlichii]ABI55587.1 Ubiquinone biosynthesis hydroxylase, UbiH/UbiF/VisC/COQ6 family [Alkalilimnicola ehrlichii MLHE-1]